MKVNLEKVIDRDQKLSNLDDRAGDKNSFGRLYDTLSISSKDLARLYTIVFSKMKTPRLKFYL